MARAVRRHRVQKARPICLPQGATVREAALAMLREADAHAAPNLAAIADGQLTAEGVHQLRVALRRLRTALRCFRDRIGPATADALRAEARWLFSTLGGLRDLQLLLASPVLRTGDVPPSSALLERLQRRLEAARLRVVKAAGSARTRRLMRRVQALEAELAETAADASEQQATLFLARALRVQRRRARRHAKRVLTHDLSEVHALRKELKRLRYTAELAVALFPRSRADALRFVRVLSRLQDVAGEFVDLAAAENTLASARPTRAMRAGVATTSEAARTHLRREVERRIERFLDAEPFWKVSPRA